MPKGVFGSKNQAAWVWTAGDTDSDLLTDDGLVESALSQ